MKQRDGCAYYSTLHHGRQHTIEVGVYQPRAVRPSARYEHAERPAHRARAALIRLRLPDYQRLLERRCCWKQSEQYTGLSPRGTNGTWASLPHEAQIAVCISRGLLL